jgi:lysyl-tRNA synthetase class 2
VRSPADRRRLAPEERARRAKLALLVEAGRDPYPAGVPRTATAGEVRRRFGALPAGARTGEQVSVAGRVRALRDFGGLVFAVVQDGDEHLQLVLSREVLGDDALRLWRRTVDRGDHVGVTGEVAASDTGELSVVATSWVMAAKCLEPVPGLRERIADPETRIRRRHLDLIVDPGASVAVRARGRAMAALREVLADRGFDEVETPVLQTVHGGAAARPFTTSINAYGLPLYLRIAPELYLKRLAVGGLQRIYEIGRNFRNEGADATLNPEFTALEAYQAYADYEVMRELARDLVLAAAVAVHGAPVAHRPSSGGGTTAIDLSGPWPVVPVHEAVSKTAGVVLSPDSGREEVLAVCRDLGVRTAPGASAGEAVLALYEHLVEPATVEPTFYVDFPAETSPLTRPHRGDPRLAERWDLVAAGMEIGTAYSELVDPVEQRRRLTEQSLRAAAGDTEAMQLDEDFLRALEYGMPPTGGLGMGVDRIVMLLTGGSIRSTLAFPFVRPDHSS